jgi:hypothetical protein
MAFVMKTSSISGGMLLALGVCACDHNAPAASDAPTRAVTPPVPAPQDSGPVASATPPRGKRSPCTTDQSCNGDPSVSALWGHCVQETGVCECNAGFELHPAGSCRPIAK